jgi:type IV pilus assembly protein PilW
MNVNGVSMRQSLRKARGASLIELMIAIAIGLIIVAALSVMYVNQTRVRAELDKNNRMTDNGRYAIELLSKNVKHAGFYGEFDPSALPVPPSADPCATDAATIALALRLAVQGINAPDVSTAPSLPSGCGLAAGMLKPGSDILVVRRAATTPFAPAAGGNFLKLQASLCPSDVDAFKLSTAAGDLTLRQKNCAANLSDARRMLVEIYFVSPYNRPGDGVPTLKRLELAPAGWSIPAGTLKADGTVQSSNGTLGTAGFVLTPLVEGIEYMQVDFGVDSDNTDGLAVADSHVAAPLCPTSGTGSNCSELANVVDVKINLVARNTEPTKFYSDQKTYPLGETGGAVTPAGGDTEFKRQTYSQFVRLVNVAGRRETP